MFPSAEGYERIGVGKLNTFNDGSDKIVIVAHGKEI